MAVLAPVKWYATYDSVLKSPATRASYGSRVAKHRESQALQQAEQNGYFLNITRDFIVASYVRCRVSEHDPRHDEVSANNVIFV